MNWIPIFIIAFAVLILLMMAVKIVTEYERGVIFAWADWLEPKDRDYSLSFPLLTGW